MRSNSVTEAPDQSPWLAKLVFHFRSLASLTGRLPTCTAVSVATTISLPVKEAASWLFHVRSGTTKLPFLDISFKIDLPLHSEPIHTTSVYQRVIRTQAPQDYIDI